MEKQIKGRLDLVSLKKVGRGALIALTGGAVLALLNYVGTIHISSPILAGFIAWLVPTLTNLVREWLKGEEIDIE